VAAALGVTAGVKSTSADIEPESFIGVATLPPPVGQLDPDGKHPQGILGPARQQLARSRYRLVEGAGLRDDAGERIDAVRQGCAHALAEGGEEQAQDGDRSKGHDSRENGSAIAAQPR
jgi:hypothetical protein